MLQAWDLIIAVADAPRDFVNRGADRISSRRLEAGVAGRIGSGAQVQHQLSIPIVSISAIAPLLDGDGPGAAPVVVQGTARVVPSAPTQGTAPAQQ